MANEDSFNRSLLVMRKGRDVTRASVAAMIAFFVVYNVVLMIGLLLAEKSGGERPAATAGPQISAAPNKSVASTSTRTAGQGETQRTVGRSIGAAVHLRTEPSVRSRNTVVAKIYPGAEVTITRAFDSGWYELVYANRTLYGFAGYFVTNRPTGLLAAETKTAVPMRSEPNFQSPARGSLAAYTKTVLVGNQGNNWFIAITPEGERFYVHQSEISVLE